MNQEPQRLPEGLPDGCVAKPQCICHRCIAENNIRAENPFFRLDQVQMILCLECGNKRCPKASDHRLACTKSNEVGQAGSVYGKPMKPTPRTDAAAIELHGTRLAPGCIYVTAAFSRELERELDEVKTLAGELIAMIRVNVMRDTFRDATIDQVDEHLKPWADKINGKARQL